MICFWKQIGVEEMLERRNIIRRMVSVLVISKHLTARKVDKSEFKIDGGEIEIVVKICLIDKDEFKDDDTSKY